MLNRMPIKGSRRAITCRLTALSICGLTLTGLLATAAIEARPPEQPGEVAAESPPAAARAIRGSVRPRPIDPDSIVVPYFYFDASSTAVVEIANRAADERTVTPIVRLFGEHMVRLKRVTIPGQGTVQVSLDSQLRDHRVLRNRPTRLPDELINLGINEPALGDKLKEAGFELTPSRWGDGSAANSAWGSLELQGDVGSLAVWTLSGDPDRSLLVNSMGAPGSRGLQVLRSSWWRPTEDSHVLFSLQNTSTGEIVVKSQVAINGGALTEGAFLTLPAGTATLVSLEDIAPADFGDLGAVGMVEFFVPGSASICGQAIIVGESKGFSAPISLRPYNKIGNGELQLPGAPLGPVGPDSDFPAGTVFSPQILLTNSNPLGGDVVVVPTIYGAKDAEGETIIEWTAPAIRLGHAESRVVDVLAELCSIPGCPIVPDGEMISIGLEYDGKPWYLMADVITVNVNEDQPLKYSFYDPLFDAAARGVKHTAVSFNLSGDKNTLLILKNATDQEARYAYKITYKSRGREPGVYVVEGLTLSPQAMTVIDIGDLRDQAVVDSSGRALPSHVTFGHAVIKTSPGVIMGDPTYDPVRGTCSSCDECCEEGEEDPGPGEGEFFEDPPEDPECQLCSCADECDTFKERAYFTLGVRGVCEPLQKLYVDCSGSDLLTCPKWWLCLNYDWPVVMVKSEIGGECGCEILSVCKISTCTF